MRLHRFYLPEPLEKGQTVHIGKPELLHQWGKVFRFVIGDRVILFFGNGKEHEGIIELISKKEAIVRLVNDEHIIESPKIELHVFQSMIKKDTIEFIAQKCTELGMTALHPVFSERSEKKNLNIERVQKIVIEASEQSGRGTIPEIFEPEKLEKALTNFDGDIFILDFDTKTLPKSFLKKKIGVVIGPEGGWSEKERDFFTQKKWKIFSLGSQVLRAETAAIAASTLILLS